MDQRNSLKTFTIDCTDDVMRMIKSYVDRLYVASKSNPSTGLPTTIASAKKSLDKISIENHNDFLSDIEIVSTCKIHPDYQGLRRPRSGCEDCMSLYRRNRPSN